MKYSQFLFSTVSLGVVVLIYQITAAHCKTYELQPGRNFKIGDRQHNDKVLFNETITTQKSDTVPNVSKGITFPPDSDTGDYLITLIEVVNNGKGGQLNVTLGGVGCRFVMFHLITQETNAIEFQVIICGYKYD